MFTIDDINRIYEAKCKKYSKEELTAGLKNILLEEAVQEVRIMNYVNNVSLC